MTVSHGVEGQLISEAMICIYSDIKALIHLGQKLSEQHGLGEQCITIRGCCECQH